jgi:hypothetical protein
VERRQIIFRGKLHGGLAPRRIERPPDAQGAQAACVRWLVYVARPFAGFG